MTTEQVHILLNKYWNCETSVAEEQELQRFFSEKNIPSELSQFIPLFAYKNELQNATPSTGFEERLQNAIRKDKKYITVRIFAPLLRIAASVVLVAGLGISLFFITRENNKPHTQAENFAETPYDDESAIRQATFALEKVSKALKTSREASLQTLQEIDNLGLDWSALDSLSTLSLTEENGKTEIEL